MGLPGEQRFLFLVGLFPCSKDSNKDQLIAYAQNELTSEMKEWSGNWLFIGEWCIAPATSFDNDDQLRSYAEAQLYALRGAQGGWSFWTWKFYNDDGSRNGWSMKAMINQGLIQL
jgi:hypothetical protein